MTHLLLSSEHNEEAKSIYEQLHKRLHGLVHLTIEQIFRSEIVHFIDNDGSHWLLKTSEDSVIVDSRNVESVLTVDSWLQHSIVHAIHGSDRSYAYQEMTAALCSMLTCIDGTVVNPPFSPSISGHARTREEWFWLAQSVGLPVADASSRNVKSDGSREPVHVYVVGNELISDRPLPATTAASIRDMQRQVNELVLRYEFELRSSEDLRLTNVNSSLDFLSKRPDLFDSLLRLLEATT
jgi:hypothetical protein